MTRAGLGLGPRWRVVVVALVVAATTTAAALVPATAVAAPVAVVDGHVDWGVKASFRSYVTGPVGGGTITTADGAVQQPDGALRFVGATGSADDDAATLSVATDGSVRFVAHGGALDLTITDVRVDRSGDAGQLVADVTSRDLGSGAAVPYPDLVVAELDLTGIAPTTAEATTTWADVPATLTTAGSEAFAGLYPPGTAMDPVTVATSSAPTSTTTTTGPATTSTTSPATTSTTRAPTTATPHGTASATGVDGQRLTVSPALDLDPAGTRVTVTGEGYDPAIGVYVAFCVDQGPAVPPSPCAGGADTSGSSGAAAWITDDPPAYAAGLTQPFGPDGTFAVELEVAAVTRGPGGEVLADCLDGATRCVVATRADHTLAAERRADVKVPMAFAGQAAPPPAAEATGALGVTLGATTVVAGGSLEVTATGAQPGEQVSVTLDPDGRLVGAGTADARGSATVAVVVPTDLEPGPRTVTARGLTSGRTGTSPAVQVVAAATAGASTGGTLPATGPPGTSARAALAVALIAGGALALVGSRRLAVRRRTEGSAA